MSTGARMSNMAALLQFTAGYGEPPYKWKDWQSRLLLGTVILLLVALALFGG